MAATASPSPALLTVAETARALRVSRRTVERLIHEGRLPAARVGRQWRVSAERLARWLAGEEPAA